jgi:hypothetical protein
MLPPDPNFPFPASQPLISGQVAAAMQEFGLLRHRFNIGQLLN